MLSKPVLVADEFTDPFAHVVFHHVFAVVYVLIHGLVFERIDFVAPIFQAQRFALGREALVVRVVLTLTEK